MQKSDRFKEHRHVKDEVVNIVDAKARLKGLHAMDIGYAVNE